MSAAPRLASRPIHSPYMEWAKTRAAARFGLAASAVASVGPGEFPLPIDGGDFTGPSFYGWPPLQEALATHLRVPSRRIVHTVGTSLANHLALAVLADPGDAVLVEHPTYGLIGDTARFLGLEVVRFDRDPARGGVPDPDEIASRMTPRTRVVVVTNLHNPTSAALDPVLLRHIAGIVGERGAWLLVDEVYLDAAFAEPLSSACDLSPNVVVTSSLTKVYGLPGLRCGWIVAPEEVADAAWRLTDLFHVVPSHAAERQSVLALARADVLRQRAHGLLATNHALFGSFLASRPELECVPPAGGTVVFPRLREGSVEALARALREHHETSVVPGGFFGSPDHFRIGVGIATATLTEGLDRIGRVLDARAHLGA